MTPTSLYDFRPSKKFLMQHPNINFGGGKWIDEKDVLRFDKPTSPVIWCCIEGAVHDTPELRQGRLLRDNETVDLAGTIPA